MLDTSHNVARRLAEMAQVRPTAFAVVEPLGYDGRGQRRYRRASFRELDQDSDRIARGLHAMGVRPGARLAVLVRPGIDFIALVFGLFKAGAVAILIDPGMGRRNLVGCLAEAEPEGFVAIPLAQAIRAMLPKRFPKARFNVTVGRRWFWSGMTLAELRGGPHDGSRLSPVAADDPAAIIFTTGSTGPPKGVLFTHGIFDAQVEQIRDRYQIRPGEVDLPGFPLFGLFNCAMGVTAVIPDMDPSRPAQVDPAKIIEAAWDWRVTQAFGSPAIWDRVGRHCEEHGIRMPTIRRVLSAGAPIPAEVLRRTRACIHPEGEVHTPYGATEALPVASISATDVLGKEPTAADPGPKGTVPFSPTPKLGQSPHGTAEQTRLGAGVCVGSRFSGIEWKVIRIVDGPIAEIGDIEELPGGEIGELIVHGPVVTRQYVTRVEWNARAKIADGTKVWHRMGDCGYLDPQERFWFCGRVAHRVLSAAGSMYPVRCEAIFNQHPLVRRSALVGVGPQGQQRPVIVLEPHAEPMPSNSVTRWTRHLAATVLRGAVRSFVFKEAGRVSAGSVPLSRTRKLGQTLFGHLACAIGASTLFQRTSKAAEGRAALLAEIRQLGATSPLTLPIADFLLHPGFPVDIRHNAKIFREKLAVWAGEQLL